MNLTNNDPDMTIYHQIQQLYVLLDDGDRRTLREVELTPTQYNLLYQLGTDLVHGATISELAERLLCTRGNITRLVQRMDEQGMIHTGSDSNDQRLVRVALTPLGAERLALARERHNASIQRRLQGVSAELREQLATLNQTLVEALTVDLNAQSRIS